MNVGPIPDLDAGPAGGEQLDGRGPVSVGGRVHRGLAVVVDGIDIDAQVQQQLHRLQDLGLGAGPGSRQHQRGAVAVVREQRVGAQIDQRLDEIDVRGLDGCQQRGWAGHGNPQIDQSRSGHPCIQVRPASGQLMHEFQAGDVARRIGRRVGVARRNSAGRRHRVQGCVADRVCRVRVRACFQKIGTQFEVAVLDRQVQGRGTGPQLRAVAAMAPVRVWLDAPGHVRARFHKGLDDSQVAVPYREEQRRESRVQSCLEFGTCLDQFRNDLRVTFCRRPDQGRLCRFRLEVENGGVPHAGQERIGARAFLPSHAVNLYVKVGAAGEQRFHRPEPPCSGCGHQGGLAPRQAGVRVRSRIQEQCDQRPVPVGAGQRERRHAVAVGRARAGTGVQEQLRRLEVIAQGGPMKGRHAVRLGRVHVRGGLDQGASALPVHRPDGVRQRRIGRARQAGREQERAGQGPDPADPSSKGRS